MCNKFAELLNQKKKKDLNKFSKQNRINSQEFVDFILACKSGFIPLKHQMNYFDYVPKHLETKECDYQTFIKGGESNSDKNKSILRRMINAHGQRKYLVGHMFRSLENLKEWHFVYFELNELKDINNHWKGGSHVHFINYLWPNLSYERVWEDFINNKKVPSATNLHVSYIDPSRKNT